MKNLVTIKVSNRTFRNYNMSLKVVKGIVGGFQYVVGYTLRIAHPVMCGALGAMLVLALI
jgi:hypothetical protein